MNPPYGRVPLYQVAASPCTDCDDPAFVLARLAEGRCNGIPGPVMKVQPETARLEGVA